MMRFAFLFVLWLFPMGCWAESFAFSNVVLGLYDSSMGKLVEQPEVIKYRPNAVCVTDSGEVDCLYYGLSFDYEVDEDKTLNCDVSSERKMKDARDGREVSVLSRKIELKAVDNSFFTPGYIVKDAEDSGVYKLCFVCRVDDKEVIRKTLAIDMGQ